MSSLLTGTLKVVSLVSDTMTTVFSAPAVFTTDRYHDDCIQCLSRYLKQSSLLTGTVMTVLSASADVFTPDRYCDDCT